MMGGSYLGWVQVYAAALKPEGLVTIVPSVTPPDPDRNFPVQFGAYEPSTLSWLAGDFGQDDAGHLGARPARRVQPPAAVWR